MVDTYAFLPLEKFHVVGVAAVFKETSLLEFLILRVSILDIGRVVSWRLEGA
jgi:hypothetical protein